MNNNERLKVYSDFRGIDKTGKSKGKERRFSDLTNMYKDYGKSKGKTLETIPGYRKRVTFSENSSDKVDYFFYRKKANGVDQTYPLLRIGDKLYLWSDYPEQFSVSDESDCLLSGIGQAEILFLPFSDRLLIYFGGKHYHFDGSEANEITPYVPTTRIGIRTDGFGDTLDLKNALTDQFVNTFVADGTTTTFYLSEKDLTSIESVVVYGVETHGYTANLQDGSITFDTPPSSPENVGLDEGFSGVEVRARGGECDASETVLHPTVAVKAFGRVFLSSDDNKICYSALDDYSYFPELNYLFVGENSERIKSMLVSGDSLFVFMDEADGGGVYELVKNYTDFDETPVVFTQKAVSVKVGAISNAVDFFGYPTFLSGEGVLTVTSPDLKSERGLEWRSSLINSCFSKNVGSQPSMDVYKNYLVLLNDGVLYLGDFNERYVNERGEYELEWYKTDGIGSYRGQYKRAVFTGDAPSEYVAFDLIGQTANPPDNDGLESVEISEIAEGVNGVTLEIEMPVSIDDDVVYQTQVFSFAVEYAEDFIGGRYFPARGLRQFDDNLWFITEDGLFSFNFDMAEMREERGIYAFDGREEKSSLVTVKSDVSFPDSMKFTVPKSFVIKGRSFIKSNFSVFVKTEGKRWKKVGDCNAGLFDFSAIDFSNLSFNTSSECIFVLNDRSKRWLEKEIGIESTGFDSPLSIEQISFRYKVKGKFKN